MVAFVSHDGDDAIMRYTMRLAAAALVLLVGSGAGWAKGMTLEQLHALALGLGYEATIDDGNVVIPDQGKSHQNLYMTLIDEGARVELTSPLYWVDGDKKAAVPYEALLRANNDGSFAFAMGSDDKHTWISLLGFYDSAILNKQSLRKAMDGLVAKLDATDALWNVDLWPAATVPKAASGPAVPVTPAAPAGAASPAGSGTASPSPAATPGKAVAAPPPP